MNKGVLAFVWSQLIQHLNIAEQR